LPPRAEEHRRRAPCSAWHEWVRPHQVPMMKKAPRPGRLCRMCVVETARAAPAAGCFSHPRHVPSPQPRTSPTMEEVFSKVGRVEPVPHPHERLPKGIMSSAEKSWRNRNRKAYQEWVDSQPGTRSGVVKRRTLGKAQQEAAKVADWGTGGRAADWKAICRQRALVTRMQDEATKQSVPFAHGAMYVMADARTRPVLRSTRGSRGHGGGVAGTNDSSFFDSFYCRTVAPLAPSPGNHNTCACSATNRLTTNLPPCAPG